MLVLFLSQATLLVSCHTCFRYSSSLKTVLKYWTIGGGWGWIASKMCTERESWDFRKASLGSSHKESVHTQYTLFYFEFENSQNDKSLTVISFKMAIQMITARCRYQKTILFNLMFECCIKLCIKLCHAPVAIYINTCPIPPGPSKPNSTYQPLRDATSLLQNQSQLQE